MQLLVFEDLELPNHKTKNIVNYVSHMDTKKVLLVDGGPVNDNLKLATGNLHYVNVLPSIVSSWKQIIISAIRDSLVWFRLKLD